MADAAKRLGIDATKPPVRKKGEPLLVLPYPGGRHPRIGFRDGAIRPQRETKASIFAPWADGGYAVADVPEAVWFVLNDKPELLYLAHTHVPTTWDRQKVTLDPLEWTRKADGSLARERTLPNKVTLAAFITPGKDGVRMEFRVTQRRRRQAHRAARADVRDAREPRRLRRAELTRTRYSPPRSPRARTRPVSGG